MTSTRLRWLVEIIDRPGESAGEGVAAMARFSNAVIAERVRAGLGVGGAVAARNRTRAIAITEDSPSPIWPRMRLGSLASRALETSRTRARR